MQKFFKKYNQQQKKSITIHHSHTFQPTQGTLDDTSQYPQSVDNQ